MGRNIVRRLLGCRRRRVACLWIVLPTRTYKPVTIALALRCPLRTNNSPVSRNSRTPTVTESSELDSLQIIDQARCGCWRSVGACGCDSGSDLDTDLVSDSDTAGWNARRRGSWRAQAHAHPPRRRKLALPLPRLTYRRRAAAPPRLPTARTPHRQCRLQRPAAGPQWPSRSYPATPGPGESGRATRTLTRSWTRTLTQAGAAAESDGGGYTLSGLTVWVCISRFGVLLREEGPTLNG